MKTFWSDKEIIKINDNVNNNNNNIAVLWRSLLTLLLYFVYVLLDLIFISNEQSKYVAHPETKHQKRSAFYVHWVLTKYLEDYQVCCTNRMLWCSSEAGMAARYMVSNEHF